jgi:energy-converting hydrogenase Eha subunit A
MSNFKRSHSGTALFVALGMIASGAAPIVIPVPAVAQLFRQSNQVSQSNQVTVPTGTLIPATREDAEKIIIKPDETLSLTLTTTQNITSSSGVILIPAGTQIEGQLQPVEGGSQFIAKELVMKDGRRMAIAATSKVITRKEEIRKGSSTNSILKGALIGAGAAAVLTEVIGDIDLIEVVAGAGVGALGGWLLGRGEKVEVVVVEPETDLALTLNSDLVLR